MPQKIILILLLSWTGLRGQNKEADSLAADQLKMNFPGIYFKHGSTDYATMPYTADSCFNYIAQHIKNVNSLVMWRDSSETEQLTVKRIKKIKSDLNKYTPAGKLFIQSMGKAQKVSQHTIYEHRDDAGIQFLLSLNSVFDVSGTVIIENEKIRSHGLHPRWWCLKCWKRGAFTNRKPPKTTR